MNASFINMNSAPRCIDGMSTRLTVLPAAFQQRTIPALDSKHFLQCREDATMPRAKQASKKTKRGTKTVPVLGAAGLTFSLVGGASAAVAPTADMPQSPNFSPSHEVTLGEEEISDVSLATFYLFDKENTAAARGGVQLARGCGCGGCRGCRGCGGCRSCRCGGCGGGCCFWVGPVRVC